MIFGVDHLALSCRQLQSAYESLVGNGVEMQFMHSGWPNDEAKRPFVREHSPVHGLCYLRLRQGIAIELTEHSVPIGHQASPYQVLMEGMLPSSQPFCGAHAASIQIFAELWNSVFGADAEPLTWTPASAQYWAVQSIRGPAVKAVALAIPEDAEVEEFWLKALGCRKRAVGAIKDCEWAHFAFASMVKNWALDVVLVKSSLPAPTPYLDDGGFPCLALLTNKLDDDLARMLEHGGSTGGVFTLDVGGASKRIAILRGPSRELIELIEIPRK
jgi:hypothetical protein